MCCRLSRIIVGCVLAVALLAGTWLVERNLTMAQESKAPLLRHVVLFKFKNSTSQEQIDKIVSEFKNLPKKITTIADFEYGTNNSPEAFSEGLTHAFLVTFKNEKDRDAYLPHQAHTAFVEILKPHLEKAVVIDYFVNK